MPRGAARTRPATVASLAIAALAAASPLRAQLPGLPVAPGAFVRPGLAVAGNAAVAGGRWGYGGALAWAPGSARWQLVGAAAAVDPGDGYRSPTSALGARAALPLLTRGRLGVTAFAGVGYARDRLEVLVPSGGRPVPDDSGHVTRLQVPVGAAVGVRGAWLGGRAWALTAVPHYSWARLDAFGDAAGAGRLRAAFVAELALSARIGLGVAVETGARGDREDPGPRDTIVGAGLSLTLGGGR